MIGAGSEARNSGLIAPHGVNSGAIHAHLPRPKKHQRITSACCIHIGSRNPL
jgi:hypothetical protein